MNESDFEFVEIVALKMLVQQQQIDNRKHKRFWKVIFHKLELQAKEHALEFEKEIVALNNRKETEV